MPITGPASYLPTADEFIPHWRNADAMLGPAGPIQLAGGVTLVVFTTLRNTLETQRAAVEAERNGAEGTRADILRLKQLLLDKLGQFNGKIRSLAPGTRWEAMLPAAFSITEGMGLVIAPLDGLADLWTRYNTAESAVLLRDGYTVAAFKTDLAALKTAYSAHTSSENGLSLARALRDETQEKIHNILKQYRQRIPSEFAEGSAIFNTLPRLSPIPGHTPDAVQLSGNYDASQQKATLRWSAPTDAAVTTLQLRASAGPDYDADDESILASFPAAGPHTWSGTFGLNTPGTATAFKIFAITAEGNEKGSNPVTITRPVE